MGFLRELGQAFGFDNTNDRADIRGWNVADTSGTSIGRVVDLMYDDRSDELRYAVVELEGRRVLLPIASLDYDDSSRRVIARGYDRERIMGLRAYDSSSWNDVAERETYAQHVPTWQASDELDYNRDAFRATDVPERIRLIEERLRVGKRSFQAGEATFTKRPVTETVSEQIELTQERVDINRIAVDRPATDADLVAFQQETIRVPLYGEEAVVEKKPFVTEEIEINKRRDVETRTVTEQVRREELVEDRPVVAERRELAFSGTEPSIEEIAERDRLDRERLNNPTMDRVDVLPIDQQKPLL